MEPTSFATLLFAFALGLKHATDADHVVAVSTMLSDGAGPRRGAQIGASWGIGHLVTVFAAGGALVALRMQFSPRVEWALELVVAVVLLWLGVQTIRKCITGRYHFHVHRHGGHAHAHFHFHARSEPGHEHAAHAQHAWARGGAKPLLVGMVHGLAGTAGLALLVLSTIPSQALGLLYLLVFGLGALAGMIVLSALLSWPLERASSRLAWLDALRVGAGATSGALGVVLVHRAFLPASWPF